LISIFSIGRRFRAAWKSSDGSAIVEKPYLPLAASLDDNLAIYTPFNSPIQTINTQAINRRTQTKKSRMMIERRIAIYLVHF